jgi:CSLREA domain-containing protein
LDDDLVEGTEQFVAGLVNPLGGSAVDPGGATAIVSLLDDEDPGQFVLGTERLVTREGEGALVATVARISGFGGAVGVSYQAQSASAGAGADFAATSGVLNWADGDVTPRTFTVPITDDGSVEATESFTLTLFNPTGLATLSQYSTTIVTLLDNDATGKTITVTVTSDDLTNNGNCTLREAVRAANLDQAVDACPAGTGADIITLAALTYTLSLAGTGEDDAQTGDLDILDDLTIRGAGASTTVINAAQIDRVLDVAPNFDLVALILEDLTVRGGDAGIDKGGGAHNQGALILRDAAFRGNLAESGGGVWSNAELLGSGTAFENNQATNEGGGLFLDSGSTSALSGLQVFSNTSAFNGGGLHGRGSATLGQSDFERNATTASGHGAGLIVYDGQAVLVDVNLRENQSSSDGGGLYLYGTWVIMTGGEVTLNTGSYGGGLYLEPYEAAVLSDVTITSNTAAGEGGGLYAYGAALLVSDSSLASNEADEGGGVYSYDARVWLVDSAIQDNQAANAGGGLLAYETHVFARQASVTGNEAVDGGGLYSDSNSFTRLLNTTVANNTATSQGGGLTNDGLARLTHAGVAGNTAPLGAGLYNDPTNSVILSVLNTLLAANTGGNCGGNALTSLGHNLSSDSTCGLGSAGDLNNVAAGLDTLALHGGPTLVQGLLNTSPAIDAADDDACPAADQRGMPRPVDGDGDTTAACDIGAFEWQAVVVKVFLPLISR